MEPVFGKEIIQRRTPSPKGYGFWNYIKLYLFSLLFTLLVLFAVLTSLESGLKLLDRDIKALMLFQYLTVFLFVAYLTGRVAIKWRSRKEDLKLGITELKNPFYDESFIASNDELKQKITDLKIELEKITLQRDNASDLLKTFRTVASSQATDLKNLKEKLNVFLRHHDNSSRFLGSASYLLSLQKENWRKETLNNILSECLTCLEKNTPDKSVSLFKVYEDELRIEHYLRISAQSAHTLRLKKGEGFAGGVWVSAEPRYIEDITKAKEFEGDYMAQDSYKSILGIPIIVNNEVLGVLCIQSEFLDGFIKGDLQTLQFYANACGLIFVHDKMNKEGSEGGDTVCW
jgi:putative methionine-R-sulfoxide reductase with GAF domain